MENSLFVYETFRVSDDRKTVDLKYTSNVGLQVYEFTETYVFPVSLPDTLETYRLLRALHIIGGISYYKTFVNTDIEHPYAMSTKEAAALREQGKEIPPALDPMDPNGPKLMICHTAPAVRFQLPEEFNEEPGHITTGICLGNKFAPNNGEKIHQKTTESR